MRADILPLLFSALEKGKRKTNMISLKRVLRFDDIRSMTPEVLGEYNGDYAGFVTAQFCALWDGTRHFEEVATGLKTMHNDAINYAFRVACRNRKAPRPERRS